MEIPSGLIIGVGTVVGAAITAFITWKLAHRNVKRPLLVQRVQVSEKDTGVADSKFSELVLLIVNEGDAPAIEHKPELVISSEGDIVFDNRPHLTSSGEIYPGHNVGFAIYRTLQNRTASNVALDIELKGYFAVLDKVFDLECKSTYVNPENHTTHESGKYRVKFK